MIPFKKDYESPTTELINLRIESGILTLSGEENTIDDANLDNWGNL
ncbi:MAG: hypothetical protein IKZ60_00735 [Bacteroidales bacterium]|nr:hypothetical protein [Bacteroidales bacterium]